MNTPKVASILLVALITLTLLNFVLKYYTYFVMVVSAHKSGDEITPIAQESGQVPHPHELYVPFLTFIPTVSPVLFRPWVIVTASFVEENFLSLAPSVLLLFYLGWFLEAKWGLQEFLKFVMLIVVLSNVLVYLFYCVRALAGTDSVPPVVVSSMAICMGLLVAVKQRIAGHYVIFFKGNLRIKVTYIPFFLLLACAFASLISADYCISFLLALAGFFSSWTYLRLFKVASNERQSYLLPYSNMRKRAHKNSEPPLPGIPVPGPPSGIAFEDSTTRGDRSELFALHTFFPGPVALFVKLFSSMVFRFAVKHHWLDAKDFSGLDEDAPYEDLNTLQSKLFSLSPLKGAGEVSAIPDAGTKLTKLWSWLSSGNKSVGIKSSMDKRRKLAIRELE